MKDRLQGRENCFVVARDQRAHGARKAGQHPLQKGLLFSVSPATGSVVPGFITCNDLGTGERIRDNFAHSNLLFRTRSISKQTEKYGASKKNGIQCIRVLGDAQKNNFSFVNLGEHAY